MEESGVRGSQSGRGGREEESENGAGVWGLTLSRIISHQGGERGVVEMQPPARHRDSFVRADGGFQTARCPGEYTAGWLASSHHCVDQHSCTLFTVMESKWLLMLTLFQFSSLELSSLQHYIQTGDL